MPLFSSSSIPLLRVDRDRVDVLAAGETATFENAKLDERINAAVEWLVSRSESVCDVTVSTRCCFVCEFEQAGERFTDAGVHYAAEGYLPLASEELAALWFQSDQKIVYVAVRKSLIEELAAAAVSVRWVLPETLLIVAGKTSGNQACRFEVSSNGLSEHIEWPGGLRGWKVWEGFDDVDELTVGDEDDRETVGQLNWSIAEGLTYSQDGIAGNSKRTLRKLDLSSKLSQADQEERQTHRLITVCQVLFISGLLLTFAFYSRIARLEEQSEAVNDLRGNLTESVFESSKRRMSDLKLKSELRLRRQREELAKTFLSAEESPLPAFSSVMEMLAAAGELQLQSLRATSESVDLVCRFTTAERCRQFVRSSRGSNWQIEVDSQKAVAGLVELRATLLPQRELNP